MVHTYSCRTLLEFAFVFNFAVVKPSIRMVCVMCTRMYLLKYKVEVLHSISAGVFLGIGTTGSVWGVPMYGVCTDFLM